jgi:hypothetical protein
MAVKKNETLITQHQGINKINYSGQREKNEGVQKTEMNAPGSQN